MGIFSGVAALASSAFDVWSGREAAEDQRHWDENAYRHRYQWQMEDMRRAGLNPMLSYMQGPGSGPSTSAASTGPGLAAGVSAAAQARRVNSEVDLIQAQATSAREQARKTKIEADIAKKGVPKADIIEDLWTTARDAYRAGKNVVQTYPLIPKEKPYRQAVQPMTERQREQLRKRGFYTRPARKP